LELYRCRLIKPSALSRLIDREADAALKQSMLTRWAVVQAKKAKLNRSPEP